MKIPGAVYSIKIGVLSPELRVKPPGIGATLENRKTDVVAYSELRHELLASDEKQAQWTAFLKNSGVDGPDSFANLLDALDLFLSPMLDAIGNRETIEGTWPASGPWNLISD